MRRFLMWRWPGAAYATEYVAERLAYTVFEHATPLIRNLPGEQMVLQRNKAVNLAIAAGRLNGLVIRPGERFSFWRQVGAPSARKGYLPGMVLREGEIIAGVGGGLCQMTNLIYWMALHTPLEVTERHRHSYDVFPDDNRTQPFGTGATCAYPGLDLEIFNPTGASYQLRVRVGESALEGVFLCDIPLRERYEVYQRDHVITPDAFGGHWRHNRVARRVWLNGVLTRDELVAENHARMLYRPFLAGGVTEETP